MKRLVLIDSNALIHRAFHALPPLSSPSGQPTNAVYGFLSVLLKMVADLKPDYIAATFDLAGPTFRHQEYEQYKATRMRAPDELYAQVPTVKEALQTLGIPILEKVGFEADDIIGTVSEQTRQLPNLQTVIVTGDLDTLQLIHGQKVVVFTLRKGMTDTVLYDEDGVRDRFSISPEHMVNFKGLRGDPSDNIPGVKGIGEKTATMLIQKFGSIEELYRELEKPEFAAGKKQTGVSDSLRIKLLDQKESALFSKKLATIVRNVPVKFDLEAAEWPKHLNRPALTAFCKDLGFFSLLKRIDATFGVAKEEPPAQSLDLNGTSKVSKVQSISKPHKLPETKEVVVHALFGEDGAVQTLLVSTNPDAVYAFTKPGADAIQQILERYPVIIGHNLKPLLKHAANVSALTDHSYIDTQVAAWLVNPEQRIYDFDRVLYEIAGQSPAQDQSTWPQAIWRLRSLLWERMKSEHVLSVFTDIEMPLLPVLALMERAGILVDINRIDELLATATTELESLEANIYKLAGAEFNINSPSQLGGILFDTLGLRGRVRRTSGGALSTAASELEKLRDEHPIIERILQYRELNKLKSTYIEPFPTLVAADGRIHTTYNQTGTATGRLSSSDPNLQNIPTRTELGKKFRGAFIAPKGYKLLSLDYSQLELRLVAHIAHDETMMEAFRAGEDIHSRTASEIFGVAPIQVTKDMRRQAKVLNFGIIYGMGVLGFARAAGVDRDTAKKFIDEYFARFSSVAEYMEETKESAFKQGYVSTLLGRRRPLPDAQSTIPQIAAQAERMAINHPIQGTGADLTKLAMIGIERYLQSHPESSARMLLQVHDELVFEVKESEVEEAAHELVNIMEHAYALDVPLVVDAKTGDNWSDMHVIEHSET